ncbi:hypothetical protein E1B28_012120 [Marasmius oreades]|uniref:DUF590-domain-containing protein n=1 Tax=Marasmius oreades TaxID=181124 RepID=A0A9P7RQW7_9AGAR|nr:uncharacterized protein E1B28_012120 [Marasmius oreades]KAG7088094.1 hypothetical protein E1B28_012120 [Marasmius oreades]
MAIGVDLVISFRTSQRTSRSKQQTRLEVTKAEEQYKLLIRFLTSAGFSAVGRRGDSLGHILVFVSCPEQLLRDLVKSERDSDFLHGLPVTPVTQSAAAALPIAPADRLRLVHARITSSPADGGLGINPEAKQWSLVESIIVLHDREFNEQWIHAWTTKRIGVSVVGLERLRQQFGESVALYFAFLDSYTRALVIPAVLGLSFYFFGDPYSPLYSSLLVLWSIGFVEWWRVRERLISVRFGTQGSQKVEKRRVNIDPREKPRWWDRELRMLSSVPVILAFATILGLLMTAIFLFEAFVTQLYTGPGQKLVSLSPTVLFVVLVPRIVSIFQACVQWFTEWERHVHHSTHDASLTLKTFIFTALVAYLGLALSAFVYVPFGEGVMRIVQLWLYKSTATISDDVDASSTSTSAGGIWNINSEYKLNPGRLQGQMFAYTVTNQIVNTFLEVGMPFILRKISKTKSERDSSSSKKKVVFEDENPKSGKEEKDLLDVAREQVGLPPYDLFGDYSEMVIQFGYVALWSTIWPLAPVMALVNNVVEMRSDAFKITVHARRPVPVRTDSIGVWVQAMSFLSWVGALTNSALVYLFCPRLGEVGALSMVEKVHRQLVDAAFAAAGAKGKGEKMDSPGDKLWNEGANVTLELLTTALLVALLASHVWLLVRVVVRHVVERVVWKESMERMEREKEDRRIKEAFLKGMVTASSSTVTAQDMVEKSGFWEYEEGVDEIRRILKEA